MDLRQTLWNSRTSGHKKLILLAVCMVLLVPSLIGLFVFSSSGDKSKMMIMLIVTVAVLIIAGVVLTVGKYTGLKWDVSNLIFAVAETGLYFTGTVNQSSYFFAEWREIASYHVTPAKNGKANVIVTFHTPADAGSFGKLTYLKMVGVTDADKLAQVMESHGVQKIQA